ncbi:putative integral membrane protein [Aspergillus taichungensis]|uniref:Efficient mitochondria targeting-associated protein 19 n=1 Tax=Aspergillus taichungensis TaxID=482145 RepID=A0A2J5I553_9EURO|nr:putative integral membrane protein [Aspergillus taichungensis]
MAQTTMAPASSIWSRKRDLIYLLFFVIHVPVIFLVDAAPLLPSFLQTDLSHQLRAFYIDTYHDKFFEDPAPAWFSAFIFMEMVYHTPLSLWAIPALLRDNPLVPIHLLVFGVQSAVTSVACLVEVWSWTDRTTDQKTNITFLYAPYIALGGLMALDMIGRLQGRLLGKSKKE